METVTKVQSHVVGAFPTATSAQLDGNTTGDAMPPAFPDVAYTTNPNGNVGITPPIVIVVGDGNSAYTTERGNDGASSNLNLDCGSRQTPTPLFQEECTSSECNSGLLGTALHSLSIESLLDVDSTSDCSRSESGDDYLDEDEVVRAEVDDSLEEYWLYKLDDQCPPDNTSGGSQPNSTSYGQDHWLDVDSAVFHEDSSDGNFTHGNVMEIKAGADTSTMIISTSHNGASSAAAESPLASSTPHPTAASGTDAKVVRIKSGYIFKLNGNGRRWSPRYLVIYPGYFCYYKNSPLSKPRGVVKLRKSSVACTEKHPYRFTVHTESVQNRRSDWVFAAHGKDKMQEWIAAFQLAELQPQHNFHK